MRVFSRIGIPSFMKSGYWLFFTFLLFWGTIFYGFATYHFYIVGSGRTDVKQVKGIPEDVFRESVGTPGVHPYATYIDPRYPEYPEFTVPSAVIVPEKEVDRVEIHVNGLNEYYCEALLRTHNWPTVSPAVISLNGDSMVGQEQFRNIGRECVPGENAVVLEYDRRTWEKDYDIKDIRAWEGELGKSWMEF